MRGSETGVCARVQKAAPHVFSWHCTAHCLSLASHKLDDITPMPALVALIREAARIGNQSAKREALKKWYSFLHNDSYLRLKKLHDIRWLSIANCIDRLLHSFVALLDCVMAVNKVPSMRTEASARLENLMRQPYVLPTLCVLQKLMDELWMCSKQLQQGLLTAEVLLDILDALKANVTASYLPPQPKASSDEDGLDSVPGSDGDSDAGGSSERDSLSGTESVVAASDEGSEDDEPEESEDEELIAPRFGRAFVELKEIGRAHV